MIRPTRQHLLIDADDTLWENQAYFVEILTRFMDLMEERGHRRDVVLATLQRVEAARTAGRGYGSGNFAQSLSETTTRFEDGCPEDLMELFVGWGRWIHDHPVETFPGVRTTLEELGERHDLFLVTKGDVGEQEGKLERSGLGLLFRHVEILPEKDEHEYRSVISRHRLRCDLTWMVGNSPRSDINPARRAGLRTVYIPHKSLPDFEIAPLADPPDLTLQRFRDLLEHF